jgi:hypothetical protein
MKSLEFSSHNPSDLSFPKNVEKFNLSNLSTLSFHIIIYYNNLQIEMTDYLGNILDAATSLKTVDFRLVSADPSTQSTDQLEVMNEFGKTIATKIPRTCNHLKLNIFITDHHISLLEQRGLHLECLIIDFQKISISTKVLESFLKSQSRSLINLEFIEAPLWDSDMKFPILPNLKYLKIEGKPRLPQCNFEKIFPKLKFIEILFYWIYQDDKWLSNVLLDAGHSKTVVDVEFLCEVNEQDLFMLHRIVKCFPCMKRLSVVFNTTTALSILFSEKFSFLEDLEISLARDFWGQTGPERMGKVDSSFSGLPADLCCQLLRENDFYSTDIPSTLCEPSIRDLKSNYYDN